MFVWVDNKFISIWKITHFNKKIIIVNLIRNDLLFRSQSILIKQ